MYVLCTSTSQIHVLCMCTIRRVLFENKNKSLALRKSKIKSQVLCEVQVVFRFSMKVKVTARFVLE